MSVSLLPFPSRYIYFSSRSLALALIVLQGECLRLFRVCIAARRLLYQLLSPWPYQTPTYAHTVLAQCHLYDTWDFSRIHLMFGGGSVRVLSPHTTLLSPFVFKHTLLQDHTWLRAHTALPSSGLSHKLHDKVAERRKETYCIDPRAEPNKTQGPCAMTLLHCAC